MRSREIILRFSALGLGVSGFLGFRFWGWCKIGGLVQAVRFAREVPQFSRFGSEVSCKGLSISNMWCHKHTLGMILGEGKFWAVPLNAKSLNLKIKNWKIRTYAVGEERGLPELWVHRFSHVREPSRVTCQHVLWYGGELT